MELVGDRLEVHVGGIQQTIVHLGMGGHGYMTSQDNLMPHLSQSVVTHYLDNDMPAMMAAFKKVLRLLAWDQKFGNVRGLKAALNELGLYGGNVRRPRVPVTSEAMKAQVLEMIRD